LPGPPTNPFPGARDSQRGHVMLKPKRRWFHLVTGPSDDPPGNRGVSLANAPDGGAELTAQERLMELLRRFGRHSHSFLCMSTIFERYGSLDPDGPGLISYVNTPFAWVGAGEPLCAPEKLRDLLHGFAEAARKHGKVAVLLPVGLEVGRVAGLA